MHTFNSILTFFTSSELVFIDSIMYTGAPDTILLLSPSIINPFEFFIPYSSNTFWKFGVFILPKFESNNNKISPPFFIYFSISSLSFWSMSSFSAVITNNLQSSGTLPLVNKFINSTSFASAVNELSKYSKYPSLYKLCPVKKQILGFTFVVTSKIAFVIASSVTSICSYVV